MSPFRDLLRTNRNYRWMWLGQIVSEVGDHFNNVAVFSLALNVTGSGLAVTGVMLARALPAVMAGPIAGVILDRLNRRWIMISSDLLRGVLALLFIFTVHQRGAGLLYILSALLMFASPFFTSGRSSILPTIATEDELHTANSLTQTTQWTTLTIGALLAGTAVMQFGYQWAFVLNAASFFASAYCISRLKLAKGGFAVKRDGSRPSSKVARPWEEYPTGGGAAQILFTLFGEVVFKRGPAGLGTIWGSAGAGLVIGGIIAHRLGPRLSFNAYKHLVTVCYVIHGGCYVIFSQMTSFWWACFFMGLSRMAVAVCAVMNFSQLLHHVSNEYRGRVFATFESLTWSVMMLSMLGAGVASQHYSPRTIGAAAGVLSSLTAAWWGYANWAGRLPEPEEVGISPEEVELHGNPTV
ncbi:MAG: MFS transporter [Acidobacteria bacterium]|nr:MFS transporter [Acidobacteriota bacterium]